jgi:hypothetical protein
MHNDLFQTVSKDEPSRRPAVFFFITAQFMGMSHTVLLPLWIVLIDRRRDKRLLTDWLTD